MIALPIFLVVLCTGALGIALPEFREYVESRSQADAACREHAEQLASDYQNILDGNKALSVLRAQCPVAKAHPAAVAALASLSAQIAIRQSMAQARIATHIVSKTGEHSWSVSLPLLRGVPADCGIAGDLNVPCEREAIYTHQSDIAGFEILCQSKSARWTYAHSTPVGIP